MAFIDRLHFYLPGWEMPNMRKPEFGEVLRGGLG
jgi:predicted ATP-dependent Lon-type protease